MLGLAVVVSTVPLLPVSEGEGPARFVPLGIIADLFAAALIAPRRLTYTLTENALVVTRLTGETRLPYTTMTAWQTEGQLGLKMGGTGLPRYYTGHNVFHADGLKSVLAASSATRGGVIVQQAQRRPFSRRPPRRASWRISASAASRSRTAEKRPLARSSPLDMYHQLSASWPLWAWSPRAGSPKQGRGLPRVAHAPSEARDCPGGRATWRARA